MALKEERWIDIVNRQNSRVTPKSVIVLIEKGLQSGVSMMNVYQTLYDKHLIDSDTYMNITKRLHSLLKNGLSANLNITSSEKVRKFIEPALSYALTSILLKDFLDGQILWHGAETEKSGKFVIKNGIVPRQYKQGRSLMAPVAGRVYLSRDFKYAAIYAIGGVVLGTKGVSEGLIKESKSRYGYLFAVRGEDLIGRDIQPDEDSIGELVHEILKGHRKDLSWLKDLARYHLTKNQLAKVKFGEYAYFAAAGKKLVKYMTPQQKAALIETGAHISVAGTVTPIHAWRFDKKRCDEVEGDTLNFFDIAEPIEIETS